MEKAAPREYTFASAAFETLFDENCPEHIRRAKLQGITQAMSLTKLYLNYGIRSDLLDLIMKKKTDLILSANTLADIKKAADPPKPHFNGISWHGDPLHVPEEELVIWSQVSMKGPLIECAYQRYMQLFSRVFGVAEEDILHDDLTTILKEV